MELYQQSITDLVSDVGTSIDDAGPNAGAVGELPGLVIDLESIIKVRFGKRREHRTGFAPTMAANAYYALRITPHFK